MSFAVLTVWFMVDSFLLFLKEIVKESFFGCMSKKVLMISLKKLIQIIKQSIFVFAQIPAF
jgi:hypothetical protein